MLASRTIETVEFKDKTLFYDIRIESVEYHLFGRTIKTYKWLRFEDWQQLYEKLEASLCSLLDLSDFSENVFHLANHIQVEVDVIPTKCFYNELFAIEANDCVPQLLQITIRQVNSNDRNAKSAELERTIKAQDKCVSRKKLPKTSKKKKTAEYSPVRSLRHSKSEYVPVPPVKSYAPYKPSKFNSRDNASPDVKDLDQAYSPKPISTDELESSTEKYSPNIILSSDSLPNTVPTYKPSAIIKSENNGDDLSSRTRSRRSTIKATTPIKLHSSPEYDETRSTTAQIESAELQAQTHTTCLRKRKRVSPVPAPPIADSDKSRLSQDLFEESDKSSDDTYNPCKDQKRTKSLHSSKKSSASLNKNISSTSGNTETKSKDSKRDTNKSNSRSKKSPSKPNKTGDWISKDSRSKAKSNDDLKNRSRIKSRSESRSPSPPAFITVASVPQFPKPTEEDLRKNREQQAKDIEKLQTFSKHLKEMNKPPPSVEIIHLNNIHVEDLLATFDEFKPILDQFFDKYKQQKRFQIGSKLDQLYLLILNIINRENLTPMGDLLQSIYEPDNDGVPSYTDLFMNIMLPEWALAIFMKEYKFTREEAIGQIKRQQEDDWINQSLA